jgi:hypothetical protein
LNAVWESLSNIEGDNEIYDKNFKLYNEQIATTPQINASKTLKEE